MQKTSGFVAEHTNDLNKKLFDAKKKIADLEAELDRLKKDNASFRAMVEAHEEVKAKLQAERDRLKEALKKYGKHWQGCKLNTRNNNGKCTCGYEQALSGGKETT